MSDVRGVGLASSATTASPTVARKRREAFDAAMVRYYAALVKRLVFVLGNQQDAEDVAQDAYLQAFRAWGGFDGRDPRAWIYTIALRLAFNRLRGRKRRLLPGWRSETSSWDAPSDPDLWAALMRLEARQRACLLLNSRDGFTQAEIAAMMSLPEGTVSSWISRARARLREDLETR